MHCYLTYQSNIILCIYITDSVLQICLNLFIQGSIENVIYFCKQPNSKKYTILNYNVHNDILPDVIKTYMIQNSMYDTISLISFVNQPLSFEQLFRYDYPVSHYNVFDTFLYSLLGDIGKPAFRMLAFRISLALSVGQ